jgi:hypothetical protein
MQWFSSGTAFSEYAPGGHYKMSKEDKRENIIMVSVCLSTFDRPMTLIIVQIASEPLTFEKGPLISNCARVYRD